MASDLRRQHSDKVIYLVLVPAQTALLGRNCPCDKRI